MVQLFTNSGDPDQTPRSAASDLGLHCLPVTRFGVSSLQWAKSAHAHPLGIGRSMNVGLTSAASIQRVCNFIYCCLMTAGMRSSSYF